MMQDLVTEKWEDFLKRYYWDEIIEMSNSYPERRSLFVGFSDMDIYDPTIADMLLEDPDVTIEAATRALREMDIPTGVTLDEANLRIIRLPRRVKIRDIRSNDIGKLVGIEGLVTKATEVRPRIVEAVFECPFCHHIFSITQSGRQFKEPVECEQESGGCGRKARQFNLSVDKSKFANAQKIRLQESPEELRGGELPQAIDVNLEDDISGEVSPGGRVIVTGILRSYQRTTQFGKTPFFDIYLDGNSLELKEEEFGEIEITEADEREIMELKNQPDVYEKFMRSIAPSIYGYEEIKEAIILQLFAGVPKELPDETRVRGDIHVLLVGDPGVAKCISGDTEILLSDGSLQDIRTIVDGEAPKKISGSVDDGICIETNHDLVSLSLNAKTVLSKGDLLWKRWATPKMYRILTSSGKEIKVTPTHPFFVCGEDAHLRKKKAEDLKEGVFIATPRKIEVFGTPQPLNITYRQSRARNAVRLKLPSHTTSEFWRFIGLFIAEGYLESKVHNGYPQCTAFFTNNNPQLIEEYRAFAKKLGLNPSYRDSHKGKSAKEIYIPGIEFGTFLENLGAAGPSGSKIVPELLFKCSKGEIAAFLSALFDGEGTVSEKDRKIGITSASRKLLSQVQHLLLRFGIRSQLHPTLSKASNSPRPRKKEYYRLFITGEEVMKFAREIGFTVAEKKEKLQKICSSTFIYNTNVDVIPNISSLLKETRTKLRLSQFECGITRSAYQHYERGDRNPSRSALNRVVQQFEKRINWLAEVRKRLPSSNWHDLRTIRKSLHRSQHEISSSSGFSQTLLSQYELRKIGHAKIKPEHNFVELTKNKVIRALLKYVSEMEDVIELVSALKTTVNSDIFWDRVEKIEEFVSEDEFVYDIQVPVYHNFVANDIYVHNSQLLTYLVKLAPRGLYTGGKSSSAAGLTAAAVRDEFGEGRWTLEAGALVLADKGIAAVDEIDKMKKEDRDALHEAMEQQTVSIAKAGIMARLNARCSLLAAANPKFGRFDKYTTIAEQINMPPTLISRFDLIFTMIDRPNEEMDTKTAEHILEMHYAGELLARSKNIGKVEEAEKEHFEEAIQAMKPAVSRELLRKYVAWSKRNIFPVMTEEAHKKFLDFYIGLRRQSYEDEDAPVPVTARQLEALIRLGEARARARLSDKITVEDAECVINVVTYCLKLVSVDPETGKLDTDWIAVGTTKTRRDRAKSIREIIKELEKEYGDEVPIEEVLDLAEEEGAEREKAEDMIELMKRDGILFSPGSGVIKFVR
ncbi:MAG: helix-turn-helix domain-containing protein [Methanomicrobia archaeon]|nr:helix-turn-helix domain-containing protein [Methanomicrobia archaeon]